MKFFLFILSVILVGCGSDISDSNVYYDYSTDEMISVDDIDITYPAFENEIVSPSMIGKTLTIVEEKINNKFSGLSEKELDISELLSNHQLSVHYVPNGVLDVRGTTRGTDIYVSLPGEETNNHDSCVEKYYILAHELLHFVSNYEFGYSNSDNANHEVGNMFFMNSDSDSEMMGTVEWSIYASISTMCNG